MDLLNRLLAIDINLLTIVLMVVFFLLENWLETRTKIIRAGRHYFHNWLFFALFAGGSFLWAWVAVHAIEWMNAREIGLLYLVQPPLWLKLLLGVMLFDFTTYWFHRTAHRVPLLWRFHRVHHSDTRVSASSNLRGHPIEFVVYFGLSNITAAGIFGLDLMALGLYFILLTPFLFLEHSNLRFPVWLDKTFGLFFTTPNIHRVHHDRDQYYTDSNYADLFILWDRLFGTFRYKHPDQVQLGLKEFEDDARQDIAFLLRSPFLHIERIPSEKKRE